MAGGGIKRKAGKRRSKGIHPKLAMLGYTEERLKAAGVFACFCTKCPDCGAYIFLTLRGEYYNIWKSGKEPPILLRCTGCMCFKSRKECGWGELLHENEGTAPERSAVPMAEWLSALP